jgi:hypothetical protein
MHFRLAVKALQVALKLALIGADGLSESFVVLEDGAEAEGKDGGVLEAVSDNSGMVNASFLIEGFGWVVLADDNG